LRQDEEVRTLARARTLTVLPSLDGFRKRSVVEFLYESGLITKEHSVLDLQGADLSGANLDGSDLRWANLDGAVLSGTKLSEAYLSGADLSETNLIRANLRGANLSEADLRGVALREASLAQAIVTVEQLEQARSLEGATLPNGQKYEDWLKDRGRRKEDTDPS